MQSARRNLILFVLLAMTALVAAPSAHAQQVTLKSATLTRDKTSGVITAHVTIFKQYAGYHVSIDAWTLGVAHATSVSPWIPPRGISTVTLTFPGSAGSPGTQAPLTVSGRWSISGWGGGRWHQSLTVTLP